MSRTRSTGRRTVVAKRSTAAPVETDEIRALVGAAGDEVVAELTQSGPEDPGTHLGRGKVDELAAAVAETDAERVVVDGRLTPGQYRALESAMPDETTVIDRYRLVLEIFEAGAGDRRAQLQVELARLRYELPRLIESADEGLLNESTETGSPVYDVRDRIDRLERKLAALPDPADRFRRRRREEGFDLVTIAGYTNAGKSTLLRRLADDIDFEGEGEAAAGENPTATVADRLFETLETTTRRTTIDGRPVLATDTVGFVDELPHDLVESFSSTLSEAAAADVVALVVDASAPPVRFRDRLEVSLDVLAAQDVDEKRIVPVLNKVDRLSAAERRRRREIAADRLPASAAEPVAISALEGREARSVRESRSDSRSPSEVRSTSEDASESRAGSEATRKTDANLEALRAAIGDRLPTERATIELPNCDAAMALVSRAYDRTAVESVDYDGSEVRIECRGRPSVLERLRGRAESIEGNAP